MIRHALAIAHSFPRSSLLDVAKDRLGSEAIRDAAQAGDGHALAAWKNWIDDLALGLANVIAFVNPEIIALGGGVSNAGDFMLLPVRALVERRTTIESRVSLGLRRTESIISAITPSRPSCPAW